MLHGERGEEAGMNHSNVAPLPSWMDVPEMNLPTSPRPCLTDADTLQLIWKRFERFKREHVGCLDQIVDALWVEVEAGMRGEA